MVSILVIIEKGPSSYGAYATDIPGVVAVAATREEVERLMHEALQFYLEDIQEEHLPLPEAHSDAGYMNVAIP